MSDFGRFHRQRATVGTTSCPEKDNNGCDQPHHMRRVSMQVVDCCGREGLITHPARCPQNRASPKEGSEIDTVESFEPVEIGEAMTASMGTHVMQGLHTDTG